jgi:hypothetical protein
VLRLRIKDKHSKHLLEQFREVNQVWNYSQDLALKVLEREHRFMSAYDMAAYTKGAAKEGLSLHSQSVQAVSEEYCIRRRQFKKAKLRWRVSHGSRWSLGWIPVKASALSYRAGQVRYQGAALSLWDSFGLAGYQLRSGSLGLLQKTEFKARKWLRLCRTANCRIIDIRRTTPCPQPSLPLVSKPGSAPNCIQCSNAPPNFRGAP